MNKYKVCAVIPVYNHYKSLKDICRNILTYNIPIIIVNDGSNQKTVNKINNINKLYKNIITIHNKKNLGKGAAVMTGLKKARELGYTHVLQIDSDGQHNTKDIPQFITAMKKNPEALIIGNPIFDNTIPRIRYYCRYITHVFVWLETLSFDIKDTMCGFRIYPLKPTLKIINKKKVCNRMAFDTEIVIRLHWRGVQVINIPTKIVYPDNQTSKFKMLKDNLLISWMHTRLTIIMIFTSPVIIYRKFSKSSHWSKTKEKGSLFKIYISLFLFKLFGNKIFNFFLYIILFFYYLFSRKARNSIRTFLNNVHLKKKAFKKPSFWTGYRNFINFGGTIVDKIDAWSGKYKRSQIIWSNNNIPKRRIANKKGPFIITSHLGNMDALRGIADKAKNVKITALVYLKNAKKINSVLKSINPRIELELISVDNITPATIIMLMKKIDNGEWIVITGDRTPVSDSKNIVYVDFLGKKAAFPHGPILLASILKCTVYIMNCIKLNKQQFKVEVELFSKQVKLPRNNRNLVLKKEIQRYAHILEKHAIKHPYHWFNFYNFWGYKE